MDIYKEMQSTGVEIASHESDLYVPVTAATRAIVDRYTSRDIVTTFTDQATGKLWFDIPFAYTPFWEAKSGSKPQ